MIASKLLKLYTYCDLIKSKPVSYVLKLTIRILSNFIIPFLYTFKKKKSLETTNRDGHPKIIVSLTSFPVRIKKLWIVIESIMNQTYKVDEIVLWLSKEQFKGMMNELPSSLIDLTHRGLSIRFCEGDLKSHKKYYYAFQEFSNDIVITIDDDIIYPEDTIEKLIKEHKEHPNSIIARYTHKITRKNGNLNPYRLWENRVTENPSMDLFFGSGGGTLFPVSRIDKDICNKEVFMEICRWADDIWLNAYIRHSGLSVFTIDNTSCSILNLQYPNDKRLSSINVENNKNDIQLKDVCSYFNQKYNNNPFSTK